MSNIWEQPSKHKADLTAVFTNQDQIKKKQNIKFNTHLDVLFNNIDEFYIPSPLKKIKVLKIKKSTRQIIFNILSNNRL